ncbi:MULTISPECIES: GNAT family N-acetyltransferase [unclassified Lactococcus]|uniref:GNAT family N-acetyltransferase n=1 Tax=unclassified Lactococcus TaxID=2643510 RepID=UPI0011CBD575|nr:MULTISPECIES: GNAT family N-acetyltransferase [unclassified Lactococcus]MQW22729.1 GNAT family N-acetyltransferase [Lactococcus sp. dk101]TXK44734.1 GNAT family N-acetyltransferase [Lactococcus sp. dk310]TXK50628.1 GNAT family N-acetyltransferase [Lactococcus sp. dk322]
MEIRKIEPRDFAEVAKLENENWTLASTPHVMDSTVEKVMKKILDGESYLLAVEDDKILGFLDYSVRHRSKYGKHVATFGVMTVKEARHKGVASSLIKHFFDIAKSEKFKKITIQVMGSNPEALQLYRNLGFIEEAHLKKEFYINGNYVDDYSFVYYLDKNLL